VGLVLEISVEAASAGGEGGGERMPGVRMATVNKGVKNELKIIVFI
jgi:hypothetical protein